MSANTPAVLQDMPPEGGYKPLNWKKTVRPKGASGVAYFGIYVAWSFTWYLIFKAFDKYHQRDEFEINECRIALTPFHLAETDRSYLKRLWVNREEERELMKDVPGWVVGTWYGDKLYNDSSRMPYPTMQEFYVHSSPREFYRRYNERYWL